MFTTPEKELLVGDWMLDVTCCGLCGEKETYPCQESDRVDTDCDSSACASFIQHMLTTNIISRGGGDVTQIVVRTQFAVSFVCLYTSQERSGRLPVEAKSMDIVPIIWPETKSERSAIIEKAVS